MRIVPVLAPSLSLSSARRARALLTVVLVTLGVAAGVAAGVQWHDEFAGVVRRDAKAHGGMDTSMPGMNMPMESKPSDGPSSATTYYCPMHPSYRSDKPGDCPICNMKLVPLPESGGENQAASVEGHATVTIRPERQQLIGVKTGIVERKQFARTIRAAGRVEYDERTLSTVTLKYGGWIEELLVKSTGESIDVGQPLFTIYSPELYEAQRAYALTRAALSAPNGEHGGTALIAGSDDINRGLRQKLALWDMSEQQIGDLEKKGDAEKLTTIVSKTKGVVTRRDVTAGAYVEPGKALYELADLSTVWISADVYETEITAIEVGAEATVELESLPGERLAGRIVYVYPYLNETTRTARVRIEVANPEGKLKPGMYATVSIAVDFGEQLVIDDDAILDTGTRKLAFVESGEGRFEPRTLTVSYRGDGRAVVLSGVQAGERVVTSANFLIDSESRLQAALHAGMQSTPGMEGMDHSQSKPTGGHDHH